MVAHPADPASEPAPFLAGPLHRPHNPSHEAEGSIHDDNTARQLGFRGGTVGGDVLMDSFPPTLVRCFSKEWFRSGSLSLYFRSAIGGGDQVRVEVEGAELSHGESAPRDEQRAVRMVRADGSLVCEGTAAVGQPGLSSALFARDLRTCPAEQLRILRSLAAHDAAPALEIELLARTQDSRMLRGFVTERLDCYSADPGVAAPSTAVGELLYKYPRQYWTPYIGDSVGLFGAIELRHVRGPLLLDRSYVVSARVAAFGQSPKTEYFWFDSSARDEHGVVVATMRMMLRFMKASSSLYGDPAPA